MQTLDKAKASDKFSFPLDLDLNEVHRRAEDGVPGGADAVKGGHLAAPEAACMQTPSLVYRLAAVLIHKGASASHGHYGEGLAAQGGGWGWGQEDAPACSPTANGGSLRCTAMPQRLQRRGAMRAPAPSYHREAWHQARCGDNTDSDSDNADNTIYVRASIASAVAHICDQASGKWWRYDDQEVEALGQLPTGCPADHGMARGEMRPLPVAPRCSCAG